MRPALSSSRAPLPSDARVSVMRFAELPAGGVSVHWEDLRLYLPESPDNAKLKTAVPELAWSVDAHGVYSIHIDDAVELFSDLLDVPTVKDPTWTGVWRLALLGAGARAARHVEGLASGTRSHERVRLGSQHRRRLRRTARRAEGGRAGR